jgi:LPS export ABC transporter protein LptC
MQYYYIVPSFILSFLLVSCLGAEIKTLKNITLEDDIGIERATVVELLYSDSAIVRVAIHAPTLLRYIDKEKPKQVFPDGIDADFYDDNQVQTSKMIAKYAEQFQKERKVYLRDSVCIWNNKNEILETNELIWDESTEQITSSKHVKITTPTQVIEGEGFKSNLDFTDWEIYEVTGIMESKNIVDSPF